MSNTDKSGPRGRTADKPKEIPKRGWKDIALRVKNQLKEDHISIVSAGVAFYFFLALFPTIAAAISIYGLVMDPVEVERQMTDLSAALPEKAHGMISEILHSIATKSDGALGWSLIISILLSLWSANKGSSAVFEGVNIAYDEEDNRSFIKKNVVTLGFTIGGIVLGFICLMLVVGFPAFIENLGFPSVVETAIQFLRWPIMGLILIFALSFIYKIAPDRDNPEFRWVSWGAVVATILWMIGSLIFTLYVNNFGSYDKTYGSFAAVIILMLWFYLTAFIILIGAEINSEMEHQTSKDTTVGPDKPMGQRGGYHADHVAGGEASKDS